MVPVTMVTWTAVPGFKLALGVWRFDPDLHRGTVGIRGHAHHANLRRNVLARIGNVDRGVLPHLDAGSIRRGNIHARDNRRNVHHYHQRRAGLRDVAGVERPVGHYAGFGAAHFGIGHLAFGRAQLALGGGDLRFRLIDLRLLAGGLQDAEMLPGGIELCFGLRKLNGGVIDQLARQGAFFEQCLTAIENFPGGGELLLVALDIGLRLDDGFGNRGQFGVLQIRLRLFHLAFVGRDVGDQAAIFQYGQKLIFLHHVAAIDQESGDRRGDVGHHVPLIPGEQNAIGGHRAAHRVFRNRGYLHGRGRFGLGFLLLLRAASGAEQARGAQDRIEGRAIAPAHQGEIFLHRLESSREGLEVRHGEPVSHQAVVEGVARVDQAVLSVHYFLRDRFTSGVAQARQAEVFR